MREEGSHASCWRAPPGPHFFLRPLAIIAPLPSRPPPGSGRGRPVEPRERGWSRDFWSCVSDLGGVLSAQWFLCPPWEEGLRKPPSQCWIQATRPGSRDKGRLGCCSCLGATPPPPPSLLAGLSASSHGSTPRGLAQMCWCQPWARKSGMETSTPG